MPIDLVMARWKIQHQPWAVTEAEEQALAAEARLLEADQAALGGGFQGIDRRQSKRDDPEFSEMTRQRRADQFATFTISAPVKDKQYFVRLAARKSGWAALEELESKRRELGLTQRQFAEWLQEPEDRQIETTPYRQRQLDWANSVLSAG